MVSAFKSCSFFLISIVLQSFSCNLLMFVCVFAKKFPILASNHAEKSFVPWPLGNKNIVYK